MYCVNVIKPIDSGFKKSDSWPLMMMNVSSLIFHINTSVYKTFM